MEIVWWLWVVIGIALIGSELLIGSFVLIWIGIGAVLVGLADAVFGLSTAAELFLWAVFSALMVWLWLGVLKKKLSPTRSLVGQSGAGIIGEVGLAVNDIRPFERGNVRFQWPIVGSDVWECMSEDDIKAGERAKIVSIEGNFFKVALANKVKEK